MKTRIAPARIPGSRERENHAPEGLPRTCAEVGGGFDDVGVQALERGVERQHHEGQVAVDEAEDDGSEVVEEREGFVDETDGNAAGY